MGRVGWGPGEGPEGESQRPGLFPWLQGREIAYFKRNTNQHVFQLATLPNTYCYNIDALFPAPGFKSHGKWNFELRNKGSRNTKCVPLEGNSKRCAEEKQSAINKTKSNFRKTVFFCNEMRDQGGPSFIAFCFRLCGPIRRWSR